MNCQICNRDIDQGTAYYCPREGCKFGTGACEHCECTWRLKAPELKVCVPKALMTSVMLRWCGLDGAVAVPTTLARFLTDCMLLEDHSAFSYMAIYHYFAEASMAEARQRYDSFEAPIERTSRELLRERYCLNLLKQMLVPHSSAWDQ